MKTNTRAISVLDNNIKIIGKQMQEMSKEIKDLNNILISMKNNYEKIFDKIKIK